MKEDKILAMTRGEQGAIIISQNNKYEIRSEKIDNLVDTTGAGERIAAGCWE